MKQKNDAMLNDWEIHVMNDNMYFHEMTYD